MSEFFLSEFESGALEAAKSNAVRIKLQMQKLEAFVEDMLNLARTDLVDEAIEEVGIDALVMEIIAEQADLVGASGVRVTLDINLSLVLKVSRICLYRILNNLISNALKYYDPVQKDRYVATAVTGPANSAEISQECHCCRFGVPCRPVSNRRNTWPVATFHSIE